MQCSCTTYFVFLHLAKNVIPHSCSQTTHAPTTSNAQGFLIATFSTIPLALNQLIHTVQSSNRGNTRQPQLPFPHNDNPTHYFVGATLPAVPPKVVEIIKSGAFVEISTESLARTPWADSTRGRYQIKIQASHSTYYYQIATVFRSIHCCDHLEAHRSGDRPNGIPDLNYRSLP